MATIYEGLADDIENRAGDPAGGRKCDEPIDLARCHAKCARPVSSYKRNRPG
jgi:hypothetical protein